MWKAHVTHIARPYNIWQGGVSWAMNFTVRKTSSPAKKWPTCHDYYQTQSAMVMSKYVVLSQLSPDCLKTFLVPGWWDIHILSICDNEVATSSKDPHDDPSLWAYLDWGVNGANYALNCAGNAYYNELHKWFSNAAALLILLITYEQRGAKTRPKEEDLCNRLKE
jgi:hypothetical protein